VNKKLKNEAFCIVPWTHTFISPQSERRLCCASREEFNFAKQYLDSNFESKANAKYSPQPLSKYWNSSFIKNIRLKMLAGDIPDECAVCHKKELTLSTYKDYFTEELYPDLVSLAIANTEEDGSTSMKPRSFDYRFDNTCNFSCRMCGEQLSSRWEKEKIDNGLWSKESDPWLEPSTKKKIIDFQKNVVEKEFLKAIKDKEVSEIYWVGGEPLLWDIHWKSMKQLVDNDCAKNTIIRYNTNLSITKYKGINLFTDLLPHFKKVILLASIDATGPIGEYIRTGLNWKNWQKNIKEAKKFKDNFPKTELGLDLTITLPGLFDLKNFIDFSNEVDIPIVPKIVFSFDPTIVLSPLALPRNILTPLLIELIKYNTLNYSNNNKELLKTLIDLKQRQTHEEKFPDSYKQGFITGRDKQLNVERIRKDRFTLSDIYKTREDVFKWWNQ
jgi:organic radical activating enzyme